MARSGFDCKPAEARFEQDRLRERVRLEPPARAPRSIAGADIALDRRSGRGFAAVVHLSLPDLNELERVCVSGPLTFPYVPGLLSFREGPLLVQALEQLTGPPDLLMFDGQGLAHPRRFGLACHVSVLLDLPGLGVAKSRLVGTHDEPGEERGAWTPLCHRGETIGAVVRTRDRVKPVFVSAGHRIDLETAIRMTLACGDGLRVPKPTRLADRLAGEFKRAAT